MTIPEIIEAIKPVEKAIDEATNAMPSQADKLRALKMIRETIKQKRELILRPPKEVKDVV